MRDIKKARMEREKVHQEFGPLFDECVAILFDVDPMGINYEVNTNEYEPEVGTILPRLKSCVSVDDVQRVIHQEFIAWFYEGVAKTEPCYQQAAERIWAAWIKHRGEKT